MAAFDITNVNDSSPLVKQFKSSFAKASGQEVVAFIPQKMKRVAGEAVKDLDFSLENGQSVTLVVRSDGDVVRVKLNGKELPLKAELFHFSADVFTVVSKPSFGVSANTADRNSPAALFAKAVQEIAERVRQNQAAFDKRQAQKKVVIPNSNGGNNTSSKSISAQTKIIKTELDDLDKIIVEKTEKLDDLKNQLESRKIMIEQSTTQVGS